MLLRVGCRLHYYWKIEWTSLHTTICRAQQIAKFTRESRNDSSNRVNIVTHKSLCVNHRLDVNVPLRFRYVFETLIRLALRFHIFSWRHRVYTQLLHVRILHHFQNLPVSCERSLDDTILCVNKNITAAAFPLFVKNIVQYRIICVSILLICFQYYNQFIYFWLDLKKIIKRVALKWQILSIITYTGISTGTSIDVLVCTKPRNDLHACPLSADQSETKTRINSAIRLELKHVLYRYHSPYGKMFFTKTVRWKRMIQNKESTLIPCK